MADAIPIEQVVDQIKQDVDLVFKAAYERAYQRGKADAQQWIPCSERLPKKEFKEQRRGTYLIKNEYGVVCTMNYEFEGDFGFVGWGTNRPSDIQVVKWMPLPE